MNMTMCLYLFIGINNYYSLDVQFSLSQRLHVLYLHTRSQLLAASGLQISSAFSTELGAQIWNFLEDYK